MLNQLYRNHLSRYLSSDPLITLETLVYLIQTYKQLKIERLAAYFPLPIKYESRRRRIQRLLKLSSLSVALLWFPIIRELINRQFLPEQTLYLVLDRTQWKSKNLFMIGAVISKRAIPIYWQFLEKKGASNLVEQKALLRPVLKLLKSHEIVILGDREFQSVELAKWLTQQQVCFVLRPRKSTKIQGIKPSFTSLKDIKIKPGEQQFYRQTKVTQRHQVRGISLGVYWRRTYRGMGEKEPWYLLTNLPDLAQAVTAYRRRVGIEAMFKDCKTGGYNARGVTSSD